MRRYVIRRLLSLGLSLLVASALIFSVVELVPGDPASFMLGTGAQPDTVAALRHELGLDQPLIVQYGRYLGNLLRVVRVGRIHHMQQQINLATFFER